MFLLPDYVNSALNTLNENGFEAYIVGGAVRDLFMDKEPHDYDITTNALPEEIIAIFEKTIPTGIKHGTVTVIIDNKSIEITTYRTDGEYTDHRSPENVEFSKRLTDDLSRRDFTVNAIAYNNDDGTIDIFGGEKDIRNGIIRAVGEPEKRFDEDALRILRAFRFAAVLNFNIEEKTLSAIQNTAYLLKFISVERIFTELIKTLMSDNPHFIENLITFGGLEFCGIREIKNPQILSKLPKNQYLRFFAFCFLCGVDSPSICQLFKTDNRYKKHFKELVLLKNCELPKNKTELKYILNKYNKESVLIFLQFESVVLNTDISFLLNCYDEIINNNEPYKISQLDIDGNTIISLGFENETVGEIMYILMDKVINDPTLNTEEQLINIIKQK